MKARSCLVLGSGRGGTSMVAGTLSGDGYYMGEHPLPDNQANPRGFFEDREINSLNEMLLAPVSPVRPDGVAGEPEPHPVYGWQRWLAPIPVGTRIPCPPYVARRIEAQTARSPFCFKDPRFCYTLPAWRPFLRDAVLVCVFREPDRTARSITRLCENDWYLSSMGLSVSFPEAVEVWTLMYRHVLEAHRRLGEWLFVHYDQMLDGSAIPRLEAALGVEADRRFPDPELKRSPGDGGVDPAALGVYRRLCELAGYPG